MDVMYRAIYVKLLFSKWRHTSQLSKFPGQVWHGDTEPAPSAFFCRNKVKAKLNRLFVIQLTR